jgi:predicted kinase
MDLTKFKNLKSPYVLILIGTPLTGKSTFCNEFISKVDKDVVIISRDRILLDLHESNDYHEAFKNVNQKQVDKILKEQLSESSNKNTIIDMTNLTSKRRTEHLKNFGEDFYKVAVVFPILKWEEYQRRNEKRLIDENKHIPEGVIKSMISSYQPIKDTEGFNKVITI